MKQLSSLQRDNTIQAMSDEVLDVIVIGGGITGVGIALDAATRGMTVGLVEMQDFAEGTSSRSTKLVHGGLRYLKQFAIKEVAELGRERAIVYENGPHVTTPVWMLLPFHQGGTFGKVTTAFGLKLYDVLAGVKKGERRFMLSRDETLAKEPLIKQQGLLGGGVYVEYRTDDARLTIEVAKAAVSYGAKLLNYAKAIELKFNNLAFTSVIVQDHLTGKTHTLKAKKVINAAGPWVDEVRKLAGPLDEKHLILSKGVHLVFDESKFPLKQAIYFDSEDGRMIFAIPRDGKTYVGTTDTFHYGDPADMQATAEDVTYILSAIHYMFPTIAITEADVESSWAGVRPLIHEDGQSPSEISRKDEIWQTDNGLITIAGGKLTGYRKMAEKIVDLVSEQLSVEYDKKFSACITKKLPISGGDTSGSKYFEQFVANKTAQGIACGLSEEESYYLAKHYGTNVDTVLEFVRSAQGSLPPFIYGQLYYSMLFEGVCKPSDFFVRRTGYLYFDIALVQRHFPKVVDEMARFLEWTDEQKKAYEAELIDEMGRAKIVNGGVVQ